MNSWQIVDLQDISLFDPAFFEMVRDVYFAYQILWILWGLEVWVEKFHVIRICDLAFAMRCHEILDS